MMQPLIAKSRHSQRPDLTLEQHLIDTDRAAALTFDPERRWGKAWLRFFKLPEDNASRFLLHLRVAALFHDIGKANADFLAMAYGTQNEQQAVRHEHLSALVLHLPGVKQWLATNETLDHGIVTAAVLSHHIKAGESYPWGQGHGRMEVGLRLDDKQIQSTLRRVAAVAGLSTPPSLSVAKWGAFSPWIEAHSDGLCAVSAVKRDVLRDTPRRRLLLAVKAGLIIADSVASGVVRVGESIDKWIEEIAHANSISGDDVDAAIIGPRTAHLRKTIPNFHLHDFQRGAAEIGPRGVLLAACGSGKTLAAWKWAEAQARARPIGRVIFLYPTRGTANEGFRDYVSWAPEDEAALLHATARYELQEMHKNPSEGARGKDFSPDETNERLFALGVWPRRYFSATVDQFLSFLEHRYASLCLLPVLADAAVIIDEVHSFDRKMFDGLVAFLKEFDVPVLCMTATLPPSRRAELEHAGLRVYPNAGEGEALADLAAAERHPRYRIERLAGPDDASQRALSGYRDGLRILWVVNTVDRAQQLAGRLAQKIEHEVLCYHSRFRLKDRWNRHAQVVTSFRHGAPRVIAVTTQVCEMSLDLDADVLITEDAPIPALVQRFGRANRHLKRGIDFRASLFVYPPESVRPYQREDMERVPSFLTPLLSATTSARRLWPSLWRLTPRASEMPAGARDSSLRVTTRRPATSATRTTSRSLACSTAISWR